MMMTTLRKAARRAAASLSIGLLLVGGAGAALASNATISLSPQTTTVSIGDTFELNLRATDVDNGIGSWDFLTYFSNTGIASLDKVSFSGKFSGTDVFEFSDLSEIGAISLKWDPAELLAFQGRDFDLATLSFTALTEGVTDFGFSRVEWADMLSDADGVAIEAPRIGYAQIEVIASPVPEPSAFALLFMGVAMTVVGARKRKARRSAGQ